MYSVSCDDAAATLFRRSQCNRKDDESPPTSGKFCSAKALAMLWSSVQLMASAIARTPRQLAAVNCFSGVNKQSQREGVTGRKAKRGEGETKTRKKQRHGQIRKDR